jgi:hypothetical protein
VGDPRRRALLRRQAACGQHEDGREGSNEPPANESSHETAPRAAEQERLSIDVSGERTKIEKALNNNAERLEEIDKQLAEVQRAPNVVPPWMERRAGIKNEKAETLGGAEVSEAHDARWLLKDSTES